MGPRAGLDVCGKSRPHRDLHNKSRSVSFMSAVKTKYALCFSNSRCGTTDTSGVLAMATKSTKVIINTLGNIRRQQHFWRVHVNIVATEIIAVNSTKSIWVSIQNARCFSQIWILRTDFNRTSKYQISCKSV